MGNSFFNKINYSASNEDSESERKALEIGEDDTVLCITGSGARTLDLLVDSPKKIISIDLNPTQNYLLELKIAAFKNLKYNEFTKFIGLHNSENRLKLFEILSKDLSAEALFFWKENISLVKKGILYCGTWEKLLREMLKFAKSRQKIINKLMTSGSLEEQQSIWQKKWDTWVWRLYLKVISNRFLWVNIIREPGAKIIPKSFDVYSYMKNRIEYLVMNFDLKKNHYANLLFCGEYKDSCILPHHLREDNFELIRKNLSRIEIITDSLSGYLKKQESSISAFSLSDFSSYAPEDVYYSVWKHIIYAATPGAKFCERLFVVKRNPEKEYREIERNSYLENSINNEDEAAIYTFCAGSINKNLN